MPDLTVFCPATPGVWIERAYRAVASVQEHAPDVVPMISRYTSARDKFAGLTEVETPWVLVIDADTLCTGDVRALIPLAKGKEILCRRSNLHDHPKWREDRYRGMLEAGGWRYRSVPWNGAYVTSRPRAWFLGAMLPLRQRWYLAYRPRVFLRPHRKPDQHALALTLADLGILDDDTQWVDGEVFSWHSQPGELGLIHHFNGQIYRKLERDGRLEAAIEERRCSVD